MTRYTRPRAVGQSVDVEEFRAIPHSFCKILFQVLSFAALPIRCSLKLSVLLSVTARHFGFWAPIAAERYVFKVDFKFVLGQPAV